MAKHCEIHECIGVQVQKWIQGPLLLPPLPLQILYYSQMVNKALKSSISACPRPFCYYCLRQGFSVQPPMTFTHARSHSPLPFLIPLTPFFLPPSFSSLSSFLPFSFIFLYSVIVFFPYLLHFFFYFKKPHFYCFLLSWTTVWFRKLLLELIFLSTFCLYQQISLKHN